MPDGRRQEAGGWNRIVLHVTDVAREIEGLEKAGVKFRNEMESGPAGRQIQLEDPDGNPSSSSSRHGASVRILGKKIASLQGHGDCFQKEHKHRLILLDLHLWHRD